jgi:hypothetical protein
MSPAHAKPHLFLHIGTEKTGTTTLQAIGGLNRALLAKSGIYYPRVPGDWNHVDLAMFAASGSSSAKGHTVLDLRDIPGYETPEGLARFRAQFAQDMREEIGAVTVPYVWMSNEHLSSRIRDPEEVDRLRILFENLFSGVTVLVWLRRQSELHLSSVSTAVKSGARLNRPLPTSDRHFFFNYENILDLWAGAFGKRAIKLRLYEKPLLKNGDIAADFFDAIGVPMPDGLELVNDFNKRLDGATATFLHLFNQQIPRLLPDRDPDSDDIVEALEEISTGAPYSLPSEDLAKIDAVYQASNDRVAMRYLGRPGPLFPPKPLPAHNDKPLLTVEGAVEIAAKLWRYKQAQLRGKKR